MPDPALDAVVEVVTRRLLGSFPPDRPRSRDEFGALPMPIAWRLRAGLDAHVTWLATVPSSPWVDETDDEVRTAARAWAEAARAWAEAARDVARVPADAWAETLQRATREAVAHLIWPAPTLAAHAFQGEAEEGGDLPTTLAIQRTRGFGPFPYLPEIATRYADRKGSERIDRPGLERLFDQIDRRMTEPFGADEWTALLGPLYDVVGEAVPAAVLRAAFEARGADDLADLFRTDGAVSAEDLHARIATHRPAAPPTDDAPATGEPETSPAEEAAEPSETETVDEPKSPEPEAPEPGGADMPDAMLTPGGADESDQASTSVAADEASDADEPDEMARSSGAEDPSEPDGMDDPPPHPIIGSKWTAPDEEVPDDSVILGSPRPAPPPPEPVPELTDEEPPIALTAPPVARLDRPARPDPEPPPREDGVSADAPATAEPVVTDDAPATPPAPPDDPVEDESEPLWRRIARRQGVEVIESGPDEVPSEGGETPLWQMFTQPTEESAEAAPAAAPPDSLDAIERRVLGADAGERRDVFVAELFSGSDDDYRQTLAALDDAHSWTEATQIIARDVFQRHRVNIYGDPAVAFTDAVEAHIGRR